MRILVCLDESAFSRSILPVVRELAAAVGAAVELITVVPRDPRGEEPWSGSQAPAPLNEDAVAEARSFLASAAREFMPPAAVCVVDGPSAADAIVHHARTSRPDFIALATHSRGTLGEAALGSTAREVTRAGVAPVLLLHPIAAAGMQTRDVPIGVYAFTRDGELLGEVAEVTPERLRLHRATGRDLWLPGSAAGAITTGRLVLDIDSADVASLAREE